MSLTATNPPDAVNWQSYDAAVANPVLDACGYVPGFRWAPRTVSVKIAKTGLYWLTFSAAGSTQDGNGGAIDDVRLSALGSPYMPAPPPGAVASPVPDPQPGKRLDFDGFAIVADPFVPPAPLQ